MNQGKEFENAIKKSIPDYCLLYRLPDAAQSFHRSKNLRFSRKNPFDYILWDSKHHVLYALELKTKDKKSISFERTKDDKGDIHLHQINGLNEWSAYDGVVAGFIIEFREIETTIFLGIQDFIKLSNALNKKSFTIKDLEMNETPYFVIPQHKLRTQYRYDIDFFMRRGKKDE